MSDRDYTVTTDGYDDKSFGSITAEELEDQTEDTNREESNERSDVGE